MTEPRTYRAAKVAHDAAVEAYRLNPTDSNLAAVRRANDALAEHERRIMTAPPANDDEGGTK